MIELNQLLLQLGINSFRQPQGRPAPIPAGSWPTPESPLLAQQAAWADLADLNLQPTPGTERHQATCQRIPLGVGLGVGG